MSGRRRTRASSSPEGSTAAHIIGYVRSKGKLPTGPINYGDPLFEETWGQDGLEQHFDEQLAGVPGKRNMIFDSDGSRLLDELVERPRVGNTVVTTLNLDWQKRAEKVLKNGCERGAFVVVDIQTGEVLVMASRPTYDINVWVPTIGQEAFDELRLDETKPQYARAFHAAYPPASSFKPVVALTALTNGVVTPEDLIDCPVKIKIGDTWMRNHSKYPDGKITVPLVRDENGQLRELTVGKLRDVLEVVIVIDTSGSMRGRRRCAACLPVAVAAHARARGAQLWAGWRRSARA